MRQTLTPILATALATMVAASPAIAQQAETPPRGDDAAEAAPADPGAVELTTITVLPTRTERSVLDVPASVSVIGRTEIEGRMIDDAQELVRYEPGVTVSRQSSGADPFSNLGGFTIRGVSGNRVQTTVDGSRVIERIIDGTRDFVDFPFVRQVDIVKGPASVLWGADALGGLVAFETLDPEDVLEPGARMTANLRTSFDTFNDALTARGLVAMRVTPTISVLAGYARTLASEPELSNARADGGSWGCPRNLDYGATPCNRFDPTEIAGHNGLLKIVAEPDAAHRFELTGELFDRTTDVDQRYNLGPVVSSITGLPTGEIIDGYDRTLDLSRYRAALEHEWTAGLDWLDEVRWRVSYSPQEYDRSGIERSTSPGGDRIVTEDYLTYSEEFLEADIQLNSSFDLGPTSHRLTYGFDGDIAWTDYERIDVTRNLTTGTTTVEGGGGFNFANATTTRADLFLQDEIGLLNGRFEIIPGVRYSTYEIEPRIGPDYLVVPGKEPRTIREDAVTAQVGALFHVSDVWSVYGLYAEGFKMPTAQQLYTSLPGAPFFNLIPAPDLRPERVETYEIGVRAETGRGFVSLTAFHSDYTDFIQSFYEIPGTIDITYRNLSSVTVQGIELAAEWQLLPELIGSAGLSYQDGEQQVSPGAPVTAYDGISPFTAVAGLRWLTPIDGLEAEVVGTFASGVSEASGPDVFRPDGYAVFDAFLSWKPMKDVKVTAGVLNVFDERYFDAPLAMNYALEPTRAVAATNPLELQTAPGRTFRFALDVTF